MEEQQKPNNEIRLIGLPSNELEDFAIQAKCKFIDPKYVPPEPKKNTVIATELGKIMKHYGIFEAIITLEKKW